MAVLPASTDKDSITNQYKVKLVQQTSYVDRSSTDGNPGNAFQKSGRASPPQVVFDVTPDLTENRNVMYKTMDPIHMPGQIYVYGSTSSRTFSLSTIKLISRTIPEATKNIQTLWTLRGWTMPYFGEGSSSLLGQQADVRSRYRDGTLTDRQRADMKAGVKQGGRSLLGKPPEVLFLSAYSSATETTVNGSRRLRKFPSNIDRVPVVITSLSIPYPSDVDYIPDENGTPVPRVMVIDIQLVETRAPREFTQQFSLDDFRKGRLATF